MTSDLLQPQDWAFPCPIAFGPRRLAEITDSCAHLGLKKPFIVTDRGSVDLSFIARLQTAVPNASLFADISPNPRDDEIGAGVAAYRNGAHDGIIAIGGGSAMDGGKAICLTANNSVSLWDFEFEQTSPTLPPGHKFPPLVTIPTTSGTGAETASTAMVTHVEKGMKFCVWHPELLPSLALLDAELTLDLPQNLTAWTGVDALTHAIEAYLVPGFHPLCDGMAIEALTLISRWLPVAFAEPENLEARSAMLAGSCLAGIAFAKGLGLVHAISHMVGAEFDTQHGLTNAITLPEVLRFNLQSQDKKIIRMADAMGFPREKEAFIAAIEGLLDELLIPKRLADIGVPDDCSARIAVKALQDSAAGTNPRQTTPQELQRLIERVIMNGR